MNLTHKVLKIENETSNSDIIKTDKIPKTDYTIDRLKQINEKGFPTHDCGIMLNVLFVFT